MSTPNGAPHTDRPAIDLVVMLAGGLKPSPLAAAAGRSVLDLSVDGRQTILQHWLEHLAPMATAPQGLPVRILHGSSLAPTAPDHLPSGLEVSIEREVKEYRGPAGVVKDAAEHLPKGATVLVIEAARWFGGNLGEVVRAHHAHDRETPEPSAVTVVAGQGHAPAGIVVLERSTLDPISQLGFMDLKEQWLGRVAESGRSVRVVDLGSTHSVLLREREGMLTAARYAASRHRKTDQACQNGSPPIRSLYSGSNQDYFAALSPQATIEPNTSIVDSVIMDGAVVKAGAIVARSVICPGAVVAEAEVVVDQVRSGPAHASASGPVTPPTRRGEYSR